MHKILLFTHLLLLCLPLRAQEWSWASGIGRYYVTGTHVFVKSGSDGDVFTAGSFSGTAQLGDTTFFNDTSYYGNHGTYVARFSPANALRWAQMIRGQHIVLYDVALDEQNQFYVCGHYSSDLVLADTVLQDGPKTFLMGYSAGGKRKWLRSFERTATWDQHLAIDRKGSLLYSTYVPDSGLIFKLSSSTGATIWKRPFVKPGFSPNNICTDAHNNVLLTVPVGMSAFTIDGTSYWDHQGYPLATLLLTMSEQGELRNVETWSSVQDVQIACDAKNNLHVSGRIWNEAKIREHILRVDSCAYKDCEDYFLASLGAGSSVHWLRKISNSGYWQTGMCVLPSGEMFCAGAFVDSLVVDDVRLREQETRMAACVLKYGQDGTCLWGAKDGGDYASDALSYRVSAAPEGQAYLTGIYHNYMGREWFGKDTLPYTHFYDHIFLARVDEKAANAVEAFPPSSAFSVYPNPSSGAVTVAVGNKEMNGILIYDVSGNVVLRRKIETGKMQLELPAGLYLLQLSNADGVTTHRLSVVRD